MRGRKPKRWNNVMNLRAVIQFAIHEISPGGYKRVSVERNKLVGFFRRNRLREVILIAPKINWKDGGQARPRNRLLRFQKRDFIRRRVRLETVHAAFARV